MRARWFDSFMVVWSLVTVLMIYDRASTTGLVMVAYSADDQVILPTCETCKLIDPDHCWTCWLTYYGNGCYAC